MIYYILLAMFVVLLFAMPYASDKGGEDVGAMFGIATTIVGIFLLIFTIWSFFAYSQAIELRTQLETFQQKEVILTEKSNSTLELLKIEVERYYKYELEIFRDIRPENVNILLIKYPELKTSGLVIGYMEQIVKLNNDIYDLRFKRTDYEAKLSYFKQNQLIF